MDELHSFVVELKQLNKLLERVFAVYEDPRGEAAVQSAIDLSPVCLFDSSGTPGKKVRGVVCP